jgi:flagellar protein FlaG
MNIESVKTASVPQRAHEGVALPVPRSNPPVAKTSEVQASQKSVQAELIEQGSSDKKLTVEDAVKRLADFVAPTNSEINFSIDEESGVRVVKILDSQSKEVLRQFPSEEAIQLAQALDKLQGLFVKEKV